MTVAKIRCHAVRRTGYAAWRLDVMVRYQEYGAVDVRNSLVCRIHLLNNITLEERVIQTLHSRWQISYPDFKLKSRPYLT